MASCVVEITRMCLLSCPLLPSHLCCAFALLLCVPLCPVVFVFCLLCWAFPRALWRSWYAVFLLLCPFHLCWSAICLLVSAASVPVRVVLCVPSCAVVSVSIMLFCTVVVQRPSCVLCPFPVAFGAPSLFCGACHFCAALSFPSCVVMLFKCWGPPDLWCCVLLFCLVLLGFLLVPGCPLPLRMLPLVLPVTFQRAGGKEERRTDTHAQTNR